MTACSEVMQQIVRLPQPVIAAVHATATAAGCQLVASCDLAVASTAARFATPGVNIGLFCSTPMVALSRNVSRKHAMEMLLTGDLDFSRGCGCIGLVNRVVAAGSEREEALALARRIAAKSSHVVKIGKEAFYRQAELDLAAAYAVRLQRDGREHAGARCRGRDRSIRGEAAAHMGGSVNSRAGTATPCSNHAKVAGFLSNLLAAGRGRNRSRTTQKLIALGFVLAGIAFAAPAPGRATPTKSARRASSTPSSFAVTPSRIRNGSRPA